MADEHGEQDKQVQVNFRMPKVLKDKFDAAVIDRMVQERRKVTANETFVGLIAEFVGQHEEGTTQKP